MSKARISVIHATHGRPAKAAATMKLWSDRATYPDLIEYFHVADSDDESRFDLMAQAVQCGDRFGFRGFVEHPGHGSSARAWNFGAQFCQGDIIIQGQDDVEPPDCWDHLLLDRVIHLPLGETPFFIAVSDGYRKDALCCTAIMSRAYMKMEGHFLCPEYISVYSDDDVTYRALRNARDKKAEFINARDLVFRHRHHYHDKTVPWDSTYERENDIGAYRVGEAVFWTRNPEARTDGLKSW